MRPQPSAQLAPWVRNTLQDSGADVADQRIAGNEED